MGQEMCLAVVLVFLSCFLMVDSRASSWRMNLHEKDSTYYSQLSNSMFRGSYVNVQILCKAEVATNGKIQIQWVLEELDCIEEMYNHEASLKKNAVLFGLTYDELHSRNSTESVQHVKKRTLSPIHDGVTQKPEPPITNAKVMKVQVSKPVEYDCGQNNILTLLDETTSPHFIVNSYTEPASPQDSSEPGLEMDKADKRSWYPVHSSWSNTTLTNGQVVRAWEDGLYMFYINIQPRQEMFAFTAKVRVDMKGDYGFLPAITWPLLIVRGVLAFIYLALGTTWIFVWACAHQHTMKIHMVIGVVAVAAAVANVLSFVEFSVENSTGNEMPGLKWISMFLTVLHTGLTHLLLMIVSTGYGITRPTLKTKLLGCATCLAAITTVANFLSFLVMDEGLQIKYNFPMVELVINVIYTIFLLVVSGWIMIYSILTFKHLDHRSHSTRKLFSFTIFTASCIVAFMVNLALELWSLGFMKNCTKDWRLDWLFASVSSMTSLLLLAVLMFLWRPADPTQSYAFSPLVTEDMSLKDRASEEDEEDNAMDNNLNYDKIPLQPMSS